jgi:murein DD-endopeptidase MepM/ murein hydrolase activator NlpD
MSTARLVGASLGCALSGALTAVVTTVVLFVLIAYAIANNLRGIQVVGPMFANAIVAWLDGAAQPVASEPAWDINGTPIDGGDVFTGTVPVRTECWIPDGLPVSGPLTQAFRPAFNPAHTGIDISVREGTPVLATMCGTVVYSAFFSEAHPDGSYKPSYGYLVIVANGPYRTYYAHNSQLLVAIGQRVERGETLALAGSTGWSTGPHVHYETRYNAIPFNPLGGGVP